LNRELEKQIVDKILGEGYDKRIRPSGINNKTGQNGKRAIGCCLFCWLWRGAFGLNWSSWILTNSTNFNPPNNRQTQNQTGQRWCESTLWLGAFQRLTTSLWLVVL